VAGLGAVWPGSPTPQKQEIAVPEVPQLLGFDMAELTLPDTSGRAFSTTVVLNGQPYRLDLQPHSLRAPDFQLLVDRGDGQLHPVEPAPPATYRGTVQGVPDSRVAASLIDGKLWATINLDEETVWEVEPLSELAGPDAPEGFHAVYRDTDTVPLETIWCGTTDDMRPPQDGGEGGGDGDGGGGGGIAGTSSRVIDYAADADVEFWIKNGSNELNTMLDIELIVNGMESIYENQFNLVFEITTIVVRTGSTGSDPYSSSSCSTLLNQFTGTWTSSPESSIRRDAAQLYTGRSLSDCLGIAWLGTVCSFSWHYGVVESRAPGLNLTLRRALSAHELGHSFDALHCCGGCSGCSACRIMCPCIAGCSGIMTSFGTQAVNEITSYMNSIGCLGVLGPTIEVPFFDDFPTTNLDGSKWSFNDGGFISSIATNEPSPPNSLNLDSTGSGAYQDDEIRSSFINLVGLDDAGVFVSYHTQHKNVQDGETLWVEYWAGSTWNRLNEIISDGNDEVDFTLWVHDLTGMFPSPFHSEFRLRFRTAGDQSSDDWYIDDVLVGFETPPENDHCENAEAIVGAATPFSTIGATTDGVPETCSGGGGGTLFENDVWFLYTAECTGTATFTVCNDADFDTRLAVYNNDPCPPFNDLGCNDDAAGCGSTSELALIVIEGLQYLVRVGSPDAATEGEGTLTVSCEPIGQPCPWDCGNPSDGMVDVVDFLALLAQWGQAGTSCDVNGGGVDVTDFLEIVGNWGACP
jgi:hypothetical protein